MPPDLSVSNSSSLATGRVLDETTYEFVENETVAGNSSSLGANILLFGGLKNYYNLKRAQLDLRSSLLAVEKMRNDVRMNVTAYYLEVLCAEETIRDAEQVVAELRMQEEKTAKKVEARKVTTADLLQIRSQLADAENDVLTARNTYDIARLNLCQLLEIDDYTTFRTVAPDVGVPARSGIADSPAEVFDAARELPELEAARVGIDMARRDLQIARTAYWPTLSLSVGYGSSYSDVRQKMFRNTDGTYRYEAYPFFEQYKDNASSYVSLSLNIPIFGKFTVRKNVQRQKLAIRQAEYALRTAEKQVEKGGCAGAHRRPNGVGAIPRSAAVRRLGRGGRPADRTQVRPRRRHGNGLQRRRKRRRQSSIAAPAGKVRIPVQDKDFNLLYELRLWGNEGQKTKKQVILGWAPPANVYMPSPAMSVLKSLSPKFRIQCPHRILEPLFAEAPERIYVE